MVWRNHTYNGEFNITWNCRKQVEKYKAKVRAFPGSTVDDMHDFLKPLLKKKPSNVILHIGSNDFLDKTAAEIAT